MGLTNRKEEQLRTMPIIQSKVSKSKDGKYLIHRTIVTSIKPIVYYGAIINGTERVQEEDLAEELMVQ